MHKGLTYLGSFDWGRCKLEEALFSIDKVEENVDYGSLVSLLVCFLMPETTTKGVLKLLGLWRIRVSGELLAMGVYNYSVSRVNK
jgi:hypothetical protein